MGILRVAALAVVSGGPEPGLNPVDSDRDGSLLEAPTRAHLTTRAAVSDAKAKLTAPGADRGE